MLHPCAAIQLDRACHVNPVVSSFNRMRCHLQDELRSDARALQLGLLQAEVSKLREEVRLTQPAGLSLRLISHADTNQLSLHCTPSYSSEEAATPPAYHTSIHELPYASMILQGTTLLVGLQVAELTHANQELTARLDGSAASALAGLKTELAAMVDEHVKVCMMHNCTC